MNHAQDSLADWAMLAEARRGWISDVVWSPQGQALALAGATGISLWSCVRGQLRLRRVLEGHQGPVKGIAVSADGSLLASAGADRRICLWDLRHGGARRTLEGHESSVERVAFSPDDRLLASAGADGSVRLHEVATGRELRALRGHADEARALCFCEGGRLLASGGRDRRVLVHSVASGALLHSEQHDDWLRALLPWPADDAWLLSASRDGELRLWPGRGGTPRLSLRAHDGGLDCAAFSPEGSLLVSGGRDCMLRGRRVSDGADLGHIAAHERPVLALAFSPDGRRLASGGGDNRLRLWRRAAR